ncbi:MAG: cyclopropane fatty acyl phospholipid synthase [Minisyncoccota bacterium]
MALFKERIQDELAEIDININGTRPWDIQVNDERLYRRVIMRGSIGLGEAYMDGWWSAEHLDQFFFKILRAQLHVKHKPIGQDAFHLLSNTFFNKQSPARSFVVGERHYDIGNNLYRAMLDKRMTYTCGYWKDAQTLDEAQAHKLDLVCRKLNLQKGQRVLDIGCGWGSFAKFAAERYGVHVTGVTISKEQAALAKEMTKGLPVEILFQDYRDITGAFDHVVSLGMFEHVGHKNYRRYMEVVAKHLKDDGLFLLHTIGGDRSGIDVDPWTEKYIFPNGILPRVDQIGVATHGLFVVEDWHNFGADYDKTLMAWNDNVEARWEELQGTYGDRFHRMWTYFLLSFAGAFRARDIQLWQIVLSRNGIVGGYTSIR